MKGQFYCNLMTFDQIKTVLKTKTVGIAGCGGLGSNCAVALARIGTGTLVITDFDVISESNLNRQYFFHDQIGQPKAPALKENIKRINPETRVIDHDIKLTPENIPQIFGICDVIVEAFDMADQKEMFFVSVQPVELPENLADMLRNFLGTPKFCFFSR